MKMFLAEATTPAVTNGAPARPVKGNVEIISPLLFPTDADCVCRTAKNGIHAICGACREPIYQHCHLPNIAYGFFHPACCPCISFIPTPEEQRVIARRGHWRGARRGHRLGMKGYAGAATLHILHDRQFHGNRALVWALIRNGMEVEELQDACWKAGLELRANLQAFVIGYRCLEVRNPR
jgi:hypothetical protein